MGSKRKLVLASLLSMVVVLSFVLGLGLMHMESPRPVDAAGATEISITVDGNGAVGESYAIPVGGEQGFGVLSVTNGVPTHLIPTGEAEWYLAAEDGTAALVTSPGDVVAEVLALQAGEAGLYVSAGGLSSAVNLSLYNLAASQAKYQTGVEIISPPNSAGKATKILVAANITSVEMTAASVTNDPANTFSVEYFIDEEGIGSSDVAPYPVSFDLVALMAGKSTHSLVAVATGYIDNFAVGTDESEEVVLDIQQVAQGWDITGGPNNTPNGIPDNPFDLFEELGLNHGDIWRGEVESNGKTRHVILIGIGYGFNFVKATPVADEAVTASIEINGKAVTVTVPGGILNDDEVGFVILEVAEDLATVIGAEQAALIADTPAGLLTVGGALYAELSIIVSNDTGVTFSEINNDQLADNPVTIEVTGLAVTAGDSVRLYSHPTDVTSSGSGDNMSVAIEAGAGGSWDVAATETVVADASVSAQVSSLSLFLPLGTPGAVAITNIANEGNIDADLAGLSAGYSVGGDELVVTVDNLPASDSDIEVTIDGAVAVFDREGDELIVTVPAAAALAEASASTTVELAVADTSGTKVTGTNYDVDGFQYLGPKLSGVQPNSGGQNGGDSITVSGRGIGTVSSVTLGGLDLTSVSVSGSTQITAVTPASAAGAKTLEIVLNNNYSGSLEGAFVYMPDAPSLTSVNPAAVYNDGGYTLNIRGLNFIAPEAKASAETQIIIDLDGVPTPAADVDVLDDTRLEALTPMVAAIGTYQFKAVNAVYAGGTSTKLESATTLDITFLDDGAAAMSISAVDPDSGTVEGGNQVVITGEGWPTSAKSLRARLKAASSSDNLVKLGNANAASGGQISVPLYLNRGADVTAENTPAALTIGQIVGAEKIPGLLYDASVLNYNSIEKSANLFFDFGKQAEGNLITEGELNIVVAGLNQDPITSPAGTDYLLGTIVFDVVGAADSWTLLDLSLVTMATGDGVALTNLAAQSALGTASDTDPVPVPANPDALIDVLTDLADDNGDGLVSEAEFTSFFPGSTSFDALDPDSDGFLGEGVEPPPPGDALVNVYVGDNLVPEADLSNYGVLKVVDSSVTIVVPAGDAIGSVDVRVESVASPLTEFAIWRADSIYSSDEGGYTYKPDVGLAVSAIDPAIAWVFGGTTAEITGNAFTAATDVFFDGQAATIISQSDTSITVIVPPLGASAKTAGEEDVLVQLTDPAGDPVTTDFTYVRYTTTSAGVMATAFMFDGNAGIGEEDIFLPGVTGNTGAMVTAKFSLDPLDVSANTKTMVAARSNKIGTKYGIARVSSGSTIGTEVLDDVAATGAAVADLYNFDFHLFDAETPWAETPVAFPAVSFTTAGLKTGVIERAGAAIKFPLGGATVAQADVDGGLLSTWSVAAELDYTFGAVSQTVGDATTVQYESSILPDEFVTETTQYLTARFHNFGSAFAVRLGSSVQVPDEANVVIFGIDGTAEGEALEIATVQSTEGKIGHPTAITFTPASGAKQDSYTVAAADITAGESEYQFSFVIPDAPAAQYNVTIELGGDAAATFQKPFKITGDTQIPWFWILLTLLFLGGEKDGGGGGGPCFIATAAYGTPMADDIEVLRAVRDTYMLNNAVGAVFVDAYYSVSPAIASVVAKSPVLAATVRLLLTPVVMVSRMAMAMPLLTLGVTMFIGSLPIIRRRRRRNKA